MIGQQPFPGTQHYPGWSFLYIQADDIEQFLRLFDDIGDFIERNVKPFPNGSFGTTNSMLVLPDGRVLFGISINGEVAVFEEQIRLFAAAHRLVVAVIELPRVALDEGSNFLFEDCTKRHFDF